MNRNKFSTRLAAGTLAVAIASAASVMAVNVMAANVMVANVMAASGASTPAGDQPRLFAPEESQRTVDGDVRLSLARQSGEILVAQPFELKILVVAPEAFSLRLPEFGDSLGDFTVVDARQFGPVPAPDRPAMNQWTVELTLESVFAGVQTVPPIAVTYSAGSMGQRQIASDPMEVPITGVLAPDADPRAFRDLKPAATIAPPASRWSVAAAAVAVAALGLVGAAWWIRRQTQRLLDPNVWAIAQLERIEREPPSQSDAAGERFDQVASLVRRYVGTFGDQTVAASSALATEEVIALAAHAGWPESAVATIRRHLRDVDAVKYGGAHPSDDRLLAMIGELKQAVGEVASAAPRDSNRFPNQTLAPEAG